MNTYVIERSQWCRELQKLSQTALNIPDRGQTVTVEPRKGYLSSSGMEYMRNMKLKLEATQLSPWLYE